MEVFPTVCIRSSSVTGDPVGSSKRSLATGNWESLGYHMKLVDVLIEYLIVAERHTDTGP